MQNCGKQMNGGLCCLCCGLFACLCCAVSAFSSAHCCLPYTPPLQHLVPLLALLPHLATSTQARRQADTFTIHARLQYLMAKFVVAVAVTTPHCGTVARGHGQGDSATVWQWSRVVRQSQSLLSSSYSSRALSRCHLVVFSLWQVIFSTPLRPCCHTLLAFVDSIIRHCWLLPAACCWRYVNRYHLLSLSCAQVFCERNSNRVNFWPPPKIKGGK